MRFSLGALAGSIFLLFCLHFFSACSHKEQEQELKKVMNDVSQKRQQFRKAFRDFGDSCQTHYFYSGKMLEPLATDSLLDPYFEAQYLLYHDSLRKALRLKQQFFRNQWLEMKPVVKQWEKMDMDFDVLITKMKREEINESDGLDSLQMAANKMAAVFSKIDSLQKENRDMYWAFRKNHEEYRYNLSNLKALYSKQIYLIRK